MSTPFAVSAEQTSERTVLHARGEIDTSTAAILTDALARDSGAPVVVIDLTEVTFLASAGLAVLVAANQRTRTTGQRLITVSPPGSAVRRAIAAASLDHVLALAEDRTTAV
ncbi:STAS domain-containing protein [Actinokineospora terrae]|uniref:Anti-sigma factor antagonist n=1 Tax=Actinokineospora terrae TaxID=155974 RepID=A0A1H9XG65_9PSEU|nr:STAS domain-containing protein [Actinokineospora terrae]SES45029.1 anti-anti-sigma factor [Actinokineospora terrae]